MDEKIEPTDAMVDEAANALALGTTGRALHLQSDPVKRTYRNRALPALRAGLNHPDARGLFADEDARPWEPLVRYHPLNVGDEVRQDLLGATHTGVVGRVDKHGDPWTAEGGLIGLLRNGTWWVRHAVQELPTEDGAAIVPAGDGPIEAVSLGVKFTTRHAAYDAISGAWVGLWRESGEDVCNFVMFDDDITPGTWKVDDQ